jgi:hypothetical protein
MAWWLIEGHGAAKEEPDEYMFLNNVYSPTTVLEMKEIKKMR